MIELENQRTGGKTEHASLEAAKQMAKKIRRANCDNSRFTIRSAQAVYIGTPGDKPRGIRFRQGVPVSEMPLSWVETAK